MDSSFEYRGRSIRCMYRIHLRINWGAWMNIGCFNCESCDGSEWTSTAEFIIRLLRLVFANLSIQISLQCERRVLANSCLWDAQCVKFPWKLFAHNEINEWQLFTSSAFNSEAFHESRIVIEDESIDHQLNMHYAHGWNRIWTVLIKKGPDYWR